MMSALGLTTIAMNSSTSQREIVERVAGLFALADEPEVKLVQARGRAEEFDTASGLRLPAPRSSPRSETLRGCGFKCEI